MRFGLVGAGMIGQIRERSFKNLPGCDFVGVADLDKDRARSLAISPQTHVFDDFEQMLASDAVDAIIVSTPPQFHEEMGIAALEAGKHVLCEKPLSNSVAACRRMVETARTTGKTLATGFNQRYFPAIQFVKQTLDSGLIGELDHIRAFGGHTGLSEFKAAWMYDKKIMGGGALMDIGIHIIDLTRYLLGDVAEVFGMASCDVWKLDRSEDNGFALMLSPQGKRAILQATWTEWKGYRFYIEAYGEKGMVRAFYAPMMNMLIYMDKPGGRRHRKFNFYPMTIIEEKRHGWQSTVIKSFQQELTDFVKLCEGKQGIIADGFSGLRAVEIADAVYRSTEEKRMIRLTSPF
ncbi:MAG TPA: Gfo/Idh/MocA family oxidoreductase [Pyrinomonadaceae bacterium]